MRKFDQSLPMALLRARELTMSYFRPLLNAQGLTEQQVERTRQVARATPVSGTDHQTCSAARCRA